MRYRILAARVNLSSPQSMEEYEQRMNELIEAGFLPWGMPGAAINGHDTVIVQHMTRDDAEDDPDASPADMG